MSTLQIGSKGAITLPACLRKKYSLQEDDVLTLVDLGEGALLLRPMVSQVDKPSRQLESRIKKENISLDNFLQALDVFFFDQTLVLSSPYEHSHCPSECEYLFHHISGNA